MFADAAGKMGATRHFSHEPGAKCFIDWAGDVAHLTDKLLGTRTKVYVLVVTLPFSDKFWAEGFCDMRQKSWQEGQIHAFEEFGGVPRMWVPDNAATATDRAAAPRVTLVNRGVRALRRALRGGRPARPGPSAARQERGRIVRRPG